MVWDRLGSNWQEHRRAATEGRKGSRGGAPIWTDQEVWGVAPVGDRSLHAKFWARVIRRGDDDCWLWTGGKTQRRDGTKVYGLFHLRGTGRDSRHEKRLAHRAAWELTNGTFDVSMCVLHRCDTPLCVNPQHLFLGTRIENNADRDFKGRQWRKVDRQEARRLAHEGVPQREIAQRLGVTRGTIFRVLRDAALDV